MASGALGDCLKSRSRTQCPDNNYKNGLCTVEGKTSRHGTGWLPLTCLLGLVPIRGSGWGQINLTGCGVANVTDYIGYGGQRRTKHHHERRQDLLRSGAEVVAARPPCTLRGNSLEPKARESCWTASGMFTSPAREQRDRARDFQSLIQ